MRSRQDKDDGRDDDKTGDECGGELSSGERASAGARIGRVDAGVGEPVEGHRGRARGEHGDYDPEQLVCSRKPGGSEHCATKSEGQSEDRVLPLDHLESDAKIPQDGHKKIVRQISVLRSTHSGTLLPKSYKEFSRSATSARSAIDLGRSESRRVIAIVRGRSIARRRSCIAERRCPPGASEAPRRSR